MPRGRMWGKVMLKVRQPYAEYLWRLCVEGEIRVRSTRVKKYLNRLARVTRAFSYIALDGETIYYNHRLRRGKRYNGYATFYVA